MRRDSDGFLGIGIGIFILWAIFALVDLAILGVVIWAIIKVVLHYTGG